MGDNLSLSLRINARNKFLSLIRGMEPYPRDAVSQIQRDLKDAKINLNSDHDIADALLPKAFEFQDRERLGYPGSRVDYVAQQLEAWSNVNRYNIASKSAVRNL